MLASIYTFGQGYWKVILATFYIFFFVNAASADEARPACVTSKDLENGIVVTYPARKGVLFRRHKRLEGPYVAESYVNGIFPDDKTVTYAGLFTYKHWEGNNLIQHEMPFSNFEGLLMFEPNTQHNVQTIRINPVKQRIWRISKQYTIKESPNFMIGQCAYKAVRIHVKGTNTFPDGTIKNIQETFTYLPALMLKVSKEGIMGHCDDVKGVRKRNVNEIKWPFVQSIEIKL